jgi:homopolymeric O-antigen transport system permease protein
VRFQLFNSGEYVVLIFCGLIPFLGIADALGTGVGSVTGNAHLIRNTLFPIELIPVKAVLASQCTQIVGLGMLLVVIGALGHLTLWAFLLPLAWLMTLLFTIGLLWILSSSNVLVRDLHNMVTIMVLVLMMVSPIAYTGDMVPERLHFLLGVNPLFYIITSYRDCLMLGRFPRGGALWVLVAMALVTFSGGLWFFTRIKKVVTDYV